MKLLALFFFLSLYAHAHADFVDNINANGQVYRSLHSNATATVRLGPVNDLVVDSRKKNKTYHLPLDPYHLKHGDFYVSENGDLVVWMLKPSFLSNQVKEDTDGLMVFKDGKELGKLALRKLIDDFQAIPQTTSHSHWLLNEKYDFDLDQLLLTTSEYKTFIIDLSRVRILKESFLDSHNDAPIIVRGHFEQQSEVDRFSGAPVKLNVTKWIKGNYPHKQIEITGLGPKEHLPSGGPFVLRKEDKGWRYLGEFYDGVKRIAPQPSLKYSAAFLPRLSAQLTPSGRLILTREVKGEKGLVVVYLIPLKNLGHTPYTTVVTVIPDVEWNAVMDVQHLQSGTKKTATPQHPQSLYNMETVNAKWSRTEDKNTLLSIEHREVNGIKTDLLHLNLPSPGKNFTPHEETRLKISENPINLSSTASVSEIKDFFAKLQVKNLEVHDHKKD
ncbi:MAG TPA: hypothetical protein VNJ01_05755 [Bacteriovoracaceae bacterium]|nr:hypothetical protein [Bacteriovoracaceae bacterium]